MKLSQSLLTFCPSDAASSPSLRLVTAKRSAKDSQLFDPNPIPIRIRLISKIKSLCLKSRG